MSEQESFGAWGEDDNLGVDVSIYLRFFDTKGSKAEGFFLYLRAKRTDMAKEKVLGAVDRIDRRNLIYYIMYNYVKPFFNQFYRKIEVHGLENIPKGVPVIFAPNHQNALMDALIVLYSSPGDTVFLARADLFKKKALAFFFNSLKMMPVFRIRDGVEELGKNQEIFDITVGVLHRNHQLCLMPEGNHGHERKLRRIVKGIFRIALKAQEPKGNEPYVKIVPVGLEFGHYWKHYHDLQIVYGKPIEVSEYFDAYAENAPKGINNLKQRLEDEMKPLMIHIGSTEYYEMVEQLRPVMNETFKKKLGIEGKRQLDKFNADKAMIEHVEKLIEEKPERANEVQEKVKLYTKKVESLNVKDWVVNEKGIGFGKAVLRFVVMLFTLPVYVYGIVNNALLYSMPKQMVKGMKDKQFHSSVKMGFALLIVMPLSYTIQTLLVGIFTDEWWIWLVYLLTLYPMGRLAIKWNEFFKKSWHGARFGRMFRRKNKRASELVDLREEIVTLVMG